MKILPFKTKSLKLQISKTTHLIFQFYSSLPSFPKASQPVMAD